MKLSKEEYQGIVDSRLIDLENAIDTYKEGAVIVNDSENIKRLNAIIEASELLLSAYEAKVDAEEQELIEEVEEEYNLNPFKGGE